MSKWFQVTVTKETYYMVEINEGDEQSARKRVEVNICTDEGDEIRAMLIDDKNLNIYLFATDKDKVLYL